MGSPKKRGADLTLESFCGKRTDGRRYARYWDADDRHRSVYRYQWLWETEVGPIPDGMVLHHKNEDCTDDRLDNLELMTQQEHSRLHLTSARVGEWLKKRGRERVATRECSLPGCTQLYRANKQGEGRQQFCSRECYAKARPKRVALVRRSCAYCSNEFQQRPGDDVKKFCSHECYGKSLAGVVRKAPEYTSCLECGKPVRRRTDRVVKFCSRECSASARVGAKLRRAS